MNQQERDVLALTGRLSSGAPLDVLEAEDDEGHWVTLENGVHVLVQGEGDKALHKAIGGLGKWEVKKPEAKASNNKPEAKTEATKPAGKQAEKPAEKPKAKASTKHDFGAGPVEAHKHKNPDGSTGGWVAETAKVAPTVFVGKDAKVYGNAKVFGKAVVSGNAVVSGDAKVFGKAVVSGKAVVYGNAEVFGNAEVSGNAVVSGKAEGEGSKAFDNHRNSTFGKLDSSEVKARVATEVGARIKNVPVAELNKLPSKFGNTPAEKAVANICSQWAHTSGDTTKEAIAVQNIAAREFKLEEADDPSRAYQLDKNFISKTEAHQANVDVPVRAILRAQYEHTQETLKKLGVKTMVLFRGMKTGEFGDKGNVTTNPLTSFSTSVLIAKEFASGGRVIKVEVPVDKVFSTSITGNGCYGENEVVLLGGKYNYTKVK